MFKNSFSCKLSKKDSESFSTFSIVLIRLQSSTVHKLSSQLSLNLSQSSGNLPFFDTVDARRWMEKKHEKKVRHLKVEEKRKRKEEEARIREHDTNEF